MDSISITLLFFGLLCWELVSNGPDISIARGKPTAQSTDYYHYQSSFAVDGNYNSNLAANSCSNTGDSPSDDGLWVVDLQSVFNISKVQVYNRYEVPERLDDLYVEGFMGDPYLCPTSSLCGYNPGPSGAVVTIECPTNTLARYIRLRGKPYMALCEVDVFGQAVGDCAQWAMLKQSQKKLKGSFLQLGSVPSPKDCLAKCHFRTRHCSIFNYNNVDGSCLVLDESANPLSSDDLATDEDWNLYYSS